MYRRDCSKLWVRHLTASATPSNKAQAEWPEPEDKTSLRQIELPSQVANSTTSNTTSTASGTFSVLLRVRVIQLQVEVQKVERQGSSTVTTGTVLAA
jgi:hypothetical protein